MSSGRELPWRHPSLPAELLGRIVERAAVYAPDSIGLCVEGSYASGRDAPDSDLDISAIVPVDKSPAYVRESSAIWSSSRRIARGVKLRFVRAR